MPAEGGGVGLGSGRPPASGAPAGRPACAGGLPPSGRRGGARRGCGGPRRPSARCLPPCPPRACGRGRGGLRGRPGRAGRSRTPTSEAHTTRPSVVRYSGPGAGRCGRGARPRGARRRRPRRRGRPTPRRARHGSGRRRAGPPARRRLAPRRAASAWPARGEPAARHAPRAPPRRRACTSRCPTCRGRAGWRRGRPAEKTPGAKTASRARMRLTLPRSVLISPLWQRRRKGCASDQRGSVFVLKRAWTSAKALPKASSARSG